MDSDTNGDTDEDIVISDVPEGGAERVGWMLDEGVGVAVAGVDGVAVRRADGLTVGLRERLGLGLCEVAGDGECVVDVEPVFDCDRELDPETETDRETDGVFVCREEGVPEGDAIWLSD